MSVDLYYKLILINKFIKHNQLNNLCYAINTITLLFIVNKFFSIYLHNSS
jgi:uncharacterized membrane protein YwzB